MKFIRERQLNEHFGPADGRIGIVMQGGMYNGVMRALQRLGLADIRGNTDVPLYVLNVTYPLIDEEFLDFARDKDAVLVVEEGQPNHIEQAFGAMLHKAGMPTKLLGKDPFPIAGEYTGAVMLESVRGFLRRTAPELLADRDRLPNEPPLPAAAGADAGAGAAAPARLLYRVPGAADLRGDEACREGARAAPRRRRHRLPPLLHHAALQHRREHDGLRARACIGLRLQRARRRSGRSRSWATAASGITG